MRNKILLIIPLIIAVGCTAYKYNIPPEKGKRYFEGNTDFKNISLGIDLESDSTAYPGPPYGVEEIISELQKRNVFKEVNYVNKLENDPNLLLVSYSNITPQSQDCWSCLFSLVSIGIIPRVINENDEIAFTFKSPVDSSKVKIKPLVKYSEVLGWSSGLFKISSKWKGEYDDNNFFNSFYNQLYERREEIIRISSTGGRH